MSLHSAKLLDHFQNPRNGGVLDTPSVAVEVENPACGDLLRLSARSDGNTIEDIRYLVRGCTASIAAGSALTEWIKGRSIGELRSLPPGAVAEAVENAVGGLEPASKHAAILCADGVKQLLAKL